MYVYKFLKNEFVPVTFLSIKACKESYRLYTWYNLILLKQGCTM